MPAPPAPSVGILRHPQPIPARKSELSSYPAQLNQINQKEEEEEEGKGDGNRNQLLRGEHVAIDVQISSRGSCDMQMSLCSCCSVQECCALMKNNKRRPCPLFAGFPSSSPWSLLPPPSHSSSCQESWEDGAGMLCPEILTGDSGARLTPSEPRPMAADRPRERGPAAGLRPAAFTFYLISLGINLIDINHLNRAPRPPRPPHRPQQVMEATGRRRWARPSHSPPPTPDYSIADGWIEFPSVKICFLVVQMPSSGFVAPVDWLQLLLLLPLLLLLFLLQTRYGAITKRKPISPQQQQQQQFNNLLGIFRRPRKPDAMNPFHLPIVRSADPSRFQLNYLVNG